MKNYKIALLPGDGIGVEVIDQTVKVLGKISEKYRFNLNYTKADIGGIAIDNHDNPLPDSTLDICKASDAVLMGSVGGPKWDNLPGNKRPEAGLLKIRKEMKLFANLRPAKVWSALKDACPLKGGIDNVLDLFVVRELTGGIYFGERGRVEDSKNPAAYDTMYYSKDEVKRVARVAFDSAMKRNKKVTSVDKANVLENSRLWREAILEVATEYPEVELAHLYVDNAAMQLIVNPSQFDVIVTGNMFGDILSDESSVITGSIGMLPSASLGTDGPGLYEPVHGSAPDIAGQDLANPLATILSAAMMLKFSLNEMDAANEIEEVVAKVLEAGYRTGDLTKDKEKAIGCTKMGDLVCSYIK